MTISHNILKYIKQVVLSYRHADGLTGTSMVLGQNESTDLFVFIPVHHLFENSQWFSSDREIC